MSPTMKVLVVGMSPLPWNVYQELAKRYALTVRSWQSDQLHQEIAHHDFALIWADGFSYLKLLKLTRHLHDQCSQTILLACNCRTTSTQRATLLKSGLIDCLPTDTSPEELLIKIKLWHSTANTLPPPFTYQNFTFRFDDNQAFYQNIPIPLNNKESQILHTLLKQPNHLVSHQNLYEQAWNSHELPSSNSLEVHLSSLRRKIEKPFGLKLFETVKGRGYRVIISRKR